MTAFFFVDHQGLGKVRDSQIFLNFRQSTKKVTMKKMLSGLFVLAILIAHPVWGKSPKGIIAKGAQLIKLTGGFSFTEGPAADKKGNVYFTDQPNNKIHVWTTDNELTTFHSGAGRANGLYFDADGNLLSCSDLNNQLWKIGMDGQHTVLVADFEGKLLNGPNDLWVHPNGSIYFTDPLYKRPYWTRDPEMQQDGEHVYYYNHETQKVTRVTTDLEKPNGIVGTPDGKKLYVADIKAGKTYVYDIAIDGSLQNKKLFAEMGSDGMTIDNQGNIYVTGKGVTVFNPEGDKIEHIPVEANWTANVCFGGKKMKTLFITASDALYSIEMKVSGTR
jgi:gluconolactonase